MEPTGLHSGGDRYIYRKCKSGSSTDLYDDAGDSRTDGTAACHCRRSVRMGDRWRSQTESEQHSYFSCFSAGYHNVCNKRKFSAAGRRRSVVPYGKWKYVCTDHFRSQFRILRAGMDRNAEDCQSW